MKQSTFSAVMANSIKNLLQGYTKGIRFVAVLTVLLTMGIGQVWGATITFKTNNSDSSTSLDASNFTGQVASGEDFISSVSNLSKVYAGKSGLKFGSSSAIGNVTINLATTAQITNPKITIKSTKYSSDSGKFNIYINGSSTSSAQATPGTDLTFTYTGKITSIKIATTTKRAYLNSITIESSATNFTVGETVFIQAQSSSAWNDGACVKAWFNGNNTAATTYWLYDATGSDAGKKMFATIVPSGTSSKVQIQRFASNCSTWWNSNGDLNKSDGAETNILQTYGASENNVAWNAGGLQLYLYGTPDNWGGSLAIFSDQGNGEWKATYSNYSPTATSADFKIKDSYNGWIGNTGSNNNATLSGMVVGSTYDITATLDITTHSLTISKELKKCKVHFNMNGHGADIASKTNITPNSTITAPTEPTDADYKFEGWYKESSCTNQWNFATDEVTETMTLYAKWTKKVSYTITWKVNNNDYFVGTPTTSIYEGSTYQDLTLPTDPEGSELEACYDNKVFVGWSTHDQGYAETTEPDDLFTSDNVPDTEITADTTFYAVFATGTDGGTTTTSKSATLDFTQQGYANQTTITSLTIGDITAAFNKGSNSNAPKYYTSGAAVRVYGGGYFTVSGATGCTITKVVITFGSDDGSNAITTNAGTYSNGTWTGSASSVKFTVGGTSGNRRIQSLSVTYSTTTASPASYSGYVSKCYCVTGIALSMTGGQHKNLDVGETNQLVVTYTPENATCDKEIVSWTSSNDLVISVNNTGLVTANMAGNATITAKTEGGVSATYNITVNNPACEAWFIHYWNASTGGDECFYKVKPDDPNDHEWRTNNFSLPSFSNEDMFNVNNAQAAGGDSQKTDQIFRTSIGFADIQRGGQYCGTNPYPGQDAYGQLSIYDDSNSPNRYIAFYPAQYMVTFGKEGSSWEEMPLNNTTGYEYESEPFMVPNGYKTDDTYKYYVGITDKNGNIKYVGYEFGGVEYKKSSVDAMNTVNGLSNADMAGKWGVWHIWSNSCANNWYAEFIRYYRVDFDLNGGEGDIAPRYGKTTTPYVTFSTSDITPPTHDGYTFLGWEDQKGTTYNPTESTVTINDDLTLTAQWAKHHTVIYDANGGTTSCEDDNIYIEGETVKVCPDVPTQTGYTFDGWIRSDNDEKVKEGASFTMPDEDVTLTARWIINKYTVTFHAGSGTCDDESLTETSGGAGVTLPTANPPAACATDGWKFAGWWTEEVGATTTSPGELLTAGSNYKPTSDCTLYAVYSYTEAGGSGSTDYVLTNIKDIADDDIVIITMTYTDGTVYALSSSKESSAAPPAPTVTVSDNKLSAEPEDDLKWNISNSSGTLTIYPNGTTEKWLYCTDSNNGVRIGTNPNKAFTIDASSGYLKNTPINRYVGVYRTNPDWRCYDNTTGNTANQTLGFYVKSSGGSTTTYNSNPTCLVPVWEGATIDKTALTVNCGERSSMDGAAKITFSKDKIFDFSNPITIEASEGFLVSTSRTPNENYQQSVSQSPLVGTDYPNTFNGKFVYVRAEAPAMSEENLSGTITIKNNKGETLQTFSVTADVTCTQYTLTLVDRGVSTEQPTKYYAGETINEAPADPEGVCTDPIHYVFDGWAVATVAAGATTYTKVTFPYTVEGNTKFYAVYRYVEDGGEPSNDFIKVTKEKDDWTGDYVIINEDEEKAIGNAYKNTNTLTAVDVTIQDNKVVSPSEAVIWQIRKNGENYTMYNVSANKYAYIAKADAKGAGLSATTTNTTQDIQIIFNNGTAKVSGVDIYRCFYYYGTNTEWRTYATGSYNTGALYCRSLESYLYTTSPVCGPHLVVTEGKDIYVTGGNAGGIRDLVIAQQKVSYKATRLQTSNGLVDGTAPDVKVATNGITIGGVVTQDVKVTIDQTKEQQTDGTYTITGTITVQYQPSANNKQEDIQVQLAVDYNAEARDNFTVHARSLPAEFVIVAKSGDKWYALNGDMNTNAANPANGQVTLDSDDNPTKATYAPCNTIYTFDGVPNTGDRTRVRFQGTDGAWLWASSGTNVGIQNNVLKTTPEGNNNAYNWKLETEDNITYKFHNDNSSRLLGLSGEKFGMYASAVQELRILPYVEKCLYNYAPSNLIVKELKGSYVVLTWDAVVGATKYQYSTNATTWTDAGTEPTVTINGLTGDTEYTYYIRAYHEDAGVSQECIDYAEITFTTADCDDVPTNITYTADLNSITVSWTAAAPTATIKLFMDAEGTHMAGSYPDATSPYRISGGLDKNTTYYIQILSDGTCASSIIPVKTEDVEVDIVEWKTDSIIVDINTNETVGVTLENEVSYGTGLGTEATELFFSKYYEASYNVKLVAVYNGTKNIIDLTDYTIQYGKTSWESNYITLKDFGETKGQIQPGEEIILYSMQDGTQDDDIMDCVHDAFPDGNWVRVTSSNNTGKGTLSFGGDKTIILCKTEYDDETDEYYDNIIDVIGALKDDPNDGVLPTNENTEKPSWGDKEGWVCETGVSIADDSQLGISTNRCLLIRNNTVTSGENAVAQNVGDFVTLCSEWKGAQVPDSDVDNGVSASCENFAYVGTFDYSDYYTKYEEMPGGTSEFDENDRNLDGTVSIYIPDLYKRACSHIRVKLTNEKGEVLTDREYKVPIMITSDQTTAGQAFLELQENLATVEVDGDGNIIDTHPLSLDEVREICKTCDVVIRDNATLTKALDDDNNDHPQVNNVMIYEGASLEIPSGADYNYTINSLSLRRKGDIVASAKVEEGGKLHLPASATAPIYLDMRIDANNWHWFTLPYNCNIADVTWVDGTPAQYNKDWFIMYYDGNSRANEQSIYENHWKVYNGTTIEAGKGYIVGIQGDITHPDYTFELRFPMTTEVLTNEHTDKTVAVNAWGVKMDITPNKKGWNLVGNPYLDYYKTSENISFTGLSLIEYLGIDSITGERLYQEGGNVPFLVTPVGGGWYEYKQELASDIEMMPFTAYFVQVGDPNDLDHTDGMELHAQFESDHRGRMSLIRRAPQEVDGEQEPVIVRVEVANAKGESDKTTLIIDDRFTNEYEMNGDFFKWFGDYYRRYTKPVLYSMGADQGKRAFNALSEQLAAQPVALGMFAAQAGDYTFSLTRKRCDLSRVEEVWLYDATTATYTNLMQQDYTFTTAKTEGEGRFYLSVKMRQNAPTDITDIYGGNIVASAKDGQIIVGGLTDNTQLWIYDATGKLLHTEQTTNFQHVYDVPVVGTYFVRTQGAGQAQTIKVLVE